jgi:hypothetical protein
MSLNKQLFKYLEANAAKFKTKIAFLDVSMNVSWSEVFLLVLNLTDKLEQEFPFKDKSDQNNGIVIKGDGTVFHILMIFALVLSNRMSLDVSQVQGSSSFGQSSLLSSNASRLQMMQLAIL